MTRRKKKILKWGLSILLPVAFAAEVPIIPVDMEWVRSYETIAFETIDGDLGINEYAIEPSGGWYVQNVSKSEGNFIWTENASLIIDKIQVQIHAIKNAGNQECLDCAYYDEFLGQDKQITRVKSRKEEYDDLRYKKNSPQPKRKELVTLLKPLVGGAAIAFDTDTDTVCTSCSSLSFSYTSTGSNLGMVLIGYMDDATDADRDITASTYNLVTLTQSVRSNSDLYNLTTEFWYLAGPTSGANTMSVTFNGVIADGYTNVSTYTDVSQSAMLDASNTAFLDGGTSVSYTLTTVADNAWIVDGTLIDHQASLCVPNSGQTEILDVDNAFTRACAGYEGPITPAAGQTVSWTCSGASCTTGRIWIAAGISIAPTSAAAAVSPRPAIRWFQDDDEI